jgi:hypothetical protein
MRGSQKRAEAVSAIAGKVVYVLERARDGSWIEVFDLATGSTLQLTPVPGRSGAIDTSSQGSLVGRCSLHSSTM